MAFVVLRATHLEAFEREILARKKPKHPEPKSVRHHWSLSVCVTWRLITLEDCASSSRLGVSFWASKSHCGLPGERSLWRFGSLPWRLTRVIVGRLSDLSSRGMRWRHGLLSWISASLTRRTVVTATGIGPTNPVSSTSNWFYLFPPYFEFVFVKSLLIILFDWLHCLTTIVDWLHTIFHPDPTT